MVKKSGANDALPKNRFISRTVSKKIFLWSAVGVVVLIYVLVQLFSFFKNPGVSLEGVDDDTVVATSTFHLVGKADAKDNIILNGEQLYPAADGTFEKDITLTPGFNTLKFEIKKFLGKEYTFEKQIFYEAPTSTKQLTTPEKTAPDEKAPEETSPEYSTGTQDGL